MMMMMMMMMLIGTLFINGMQHYSLIRGATGFLHPQDDASLPIPNNHCRRQFRLIRVGCSAIRQEKRGHETCYCLVLACNYAGRARTRGAAETCGGGMYHCLWTSLLSFIYFLMLTNMYWNTRGSCMITVHRLPLIQSFLVQGLGFTGVSCFIA